MRSMNFILVDLLSLNFLRAHQLDRFCPFTELVPVVVAI